MRIVLNVAGVLCLLIGGVWFLQGINVLPGSFMTGQPKWAVIGALLVLVSIGALIATNRRRVRGGSAAWSASPQPPAWSDRCSSSSASSA